MRQGEYIRTLHEWECPYCSGKNLVDNGDMSDLTIPDVEEVVCKLCDKTFSVNPDYEGE